MKPIGALLLTLAVCVAQETPPDTVERLIGELTSEEFKVREAASLKLWEAGEAALDSLRRAADGEDPEAAHRALELLLKIELHITPDTDPQVIALVERYTKARDADKPDLLMEIRKLKGYRQVLKLYAAEKDPEMRATLDSAVENVAIDAAREALIAGKPAAARELLEIAPPVAESLVSLGAFHRAAGTLQAELAKPLDPADHEAVLRRICFLRVDGQVEAARVLAESAGQVEISASMSALAGDPMPWLKLRETAPDEEDPGTYYPSLAIRRWEAKGARPAGIEALVRQLEARDPGNRPHAAGVLFLLGEPKVAEPTLARLAPLMAFRHFDALERVPDALAAVGLDGENPDFGAWFARSFERYLASDEDRHSGETWLVAMATFMENRGLQDQLVSLMREPMKRLAEEDEDAFRELLQSFFQDGGGNSRVPVAASRIGMEWAGDHEDRWEELVILALGEGETGATWWSWLGELFPEADRPTRLQILLATFDVTADPSRLRTKALEKAWDAWAAAEGDRKTTFRKRISSLPSAFLLGTDAALILRLLDAMPEDERAEMTDTARVFEALISASVGKWETAANIFVAKSKAARAGQGRDPEVSPIMEAYTAACLRKVPGREAEAEEYERRVEELALGQAATYLGISYAYSFCGDNIRASIWLNRAAIEAVPGSEEFFDAIGGDMRGHASCYDVFLEAGKWKEAAAIAEVIARERAKPGLIGDQELAGIMLLRYRLQADTARGLALLETDREQGIALLKNCHKMIAYDGSLADYFYPSLRKAGLLAEHDAWFEETWKAFKSNLERFPNADNCLNTLGWLASRAKLHLDEALALQTRALELNPDQHAYLDTLAEIHYARGEWEESVKWSNRSLNFAPMDSMIRRQNQRFQEALKAR